MESGEYNNNSNEKQSYNNMNGEKVESNMKVQVYVDILLRIMGLLLTLVASVVVGVDKETKIVSVNFTENLPPLQLPVTAKWHYLSAFVYFLASNVIASSYAGASLAYSLSTWKFKSNLALPLIIILDIIMTGLLFSAVGAATAVGVIGRYGNSHVQWKKVCNVFHGFCRQFEGAVVLSLAGSVVFLMLAAIAVLNLHKRSK